MHIICLLLFLYMLVVIGALIMSWFPLEPGGVGSQIYRTLWNLTDPVLRPLRSVLPDVPIGGMRLDLSPLVLFIGIQILQRILCG